MNQCYIRNMEEYSLFKKFVFRPTSLEALERFKKNLFTLIAGEFAQKLSFINVELYQGGVTVGSLFVNRSESTT